MKSNIIILWVLAAYLVLAGVVYMIWNFLAGNAFEPIGSIVILLSAVLASFIAFYLGSVMKSQGGILLPEDRLEATVDDGDPEVGEFSPWSWWPIVLAGGAAIFILGLCVGFWICFVAAPLALIAIVGWTYEYYRGNFAR